MNNEPVAWMGKDYDGLKTELYFDVERNKLPYRLYESAIPLYTHPVKELTDEKITAIAKEIFKDYKNFHHYQIDFARAVIKEVSGK